MVIVTESLMMTTERSKENWVNDKVSTQAAPQEGNGNPDAVLGRIRHLIDAPMLVDDVPELAALVGQLDQWLSVGLPKPLAWEPSCVLCAVDLGSPVLDSPSHRRIWHDELDAIDRGELEGDAAVHVGT